VATREESIQSLKRTVRDEVSGENHALRSARPLSLGVRQHNHLGVEVKFNEQGRWLRLPVVIATIFSMYWLLDALGLGTSFWPLSVPRAVLFVVSFYSFETFYSWVAQLALSWFVKNRAKGTGDA
jgi:hypothetical protein